jgi:integrase
VPSGAVIEYRGKRGTVFRIKYSDAAGKQVMETLGAAREGWTRRKAKTELRRRLARVDGGWRQPSALTFGDYAVRWFTEEEAKRRWKPGTVRAYRFVRGRLVAAFGPMKLDAIRPRHVADFISSHPNGASTIRRDVDVLHAIFKSAIAAELVDANPVDGAERPKLPPFRPALLEPAEVRRVAGAFKDKTFRTVFLTMHLTGLRRFELRALRWRDVDLVDGILWVRESKSEDGRRAIAIPPALVEELARHKNRSPYNRDGEPVFASLIGNPFRAETYTSAFEAALKKAGISKRPRPFHDARHGALTMMAATGASPIAVMTTAGHASMQTTKRYLHLAGTVFPDEAAALERRLGLSTEPSTDLSEPQRTSDEPAPLASAEEARADHARLM